MEVVLAAAVAQVEVVDWIELEFANDGMDLANEEASYL